MQLCEHDIFISDERLDKATALHRVVEKLSAAGNTTTDYLRGMLDREAQISTYLGNGIAIPHGTPESRDAVLQTGVKVIVFRHALTGVTAIPHIWSPELPRAPMNILRFCAN